MPAATNWPALQLLLQRLQWAWRAPEGTPGVCMPTVVPHRRALYERLGTRDRQGLLALLGTS